jgi:sugar phosphate isomerase/epimerase
MVELGLSTYTYTWAIGVPGNMPRQPMDAFGLLELARKYHINRVQIADNIPLDQLSETELESIKHFSDSHRIQVEVGARGLYQEKIDKYLELAAYFGSPFLRFVIDEGTYCPPLDEIIQLIRQNLSKFERAGIPLAIENHDRLKCRDLIRVIHHTDPHLVGICLDTVNSLGAGEGLQEVLQQLAPYTVNFHIKDFSIRRKSHQMGFEVVGQPAGSGMLDIPEIMQVLDNSRKCLSCTLELWTSPEKTLEGTIAKEREWAEKSLKYLKTVGIIN